MRNPVPSPEVDPDKMHYEDDNNRIYAFTHRTPTLGVVRGGAPLLGRIAPSDVHPPVPQTHGVKLPKLAAGRIPKDPIPHGSSKCDTLVSPFLEDVRGGRMDSILAVQAVLPKILRAGTIVSTTGDELQVASPPYDHSRDHIARTMVGGRKASNK